MRRAFFRGDRVAPAPRSQYSEPLDAVTTRLFNCKRRHKPGTERGTSRPAAATKQAAPTDLFNAEIPSDALRAGTSRAPLTGLRLLICSPRPLTGAWSSGFSLPGMRAVTEFC